MLVAMDSRQPPEGVLSHRARMLAGEPYRSDDPELVEAHLRARRLSERFNSAGVEQALLRRSILDELLGTFGDLRMGTDCFVNFGLVALDAALITIGDDVQIGPQVQLLTPTHPTDPELRRAQWEAAEPISIGDNVWLGGGCIVLPGVDIAEDVVVGAGSVVTTNLPAGVVAVGNPARIIRSTR
jgi:maltose O-acetyltransferase